MWYIRISRIRNNVPAIIMCHRSGQWFVGSIYNCARAGTCVSENRNRLNFVRVRIDDTCLSILWTHSLNEPRNPSMANRSFFMTVTPLKLMIATFNPSYLILCFVTIAFFCSWRAYNCLRQLGANEANGFIWIEKSSTSLIYIWARDCHSISLCFHFQWEITIYTFLCIRNRALDCSHSFISNCTLHFVLFLYRFLQNEWRLSKSNTNLDICFCSSLSSANWSLSMPHDDDIKCAKLRRDGTNSQKIMSRMLDQNTHPWSWSECSRHYVTEYLE